MIRAPLSLSPHTPFQAHSVPGTLASLSFLEHTRHAHSQGSLVAGLSDWDGNLPAHTSAGLTSSCPSSLSSNAIYSMRPRLTTFFNIISHLHMNESPSRSVFKNPIKLA